MKNRILYIEDNDQNFYLVSFILSAKGYTVIRARDGKEGIERAIADRPDLILLDIQLPVMDGYTVAKKLRGIDGMETIPIVALTSYAMAGDREKAIGAGCTGYIENPINPATFINEVAAYLEAGPSGDVPR